eukprot:312661_1
MATECEGNLDWNILQSFPFEYFSQPFVINNDKLTVAASKTYFSDGDGIYKFNIHKNKWIKIFNYDQNVKCNPYSAVYDNERKLLYVSDLNLSKMSTFDLKTKNKVISMSE